MQEEREAEREAEEHRLANLTLYERIEEADEVSKLAVLLLLIAEKAGIDVHEIP